jgi:pyruvate,orthophosphate dikinase
VRLRNARQAIWEQLNDELDNLRQLRGTIKGVANVLNTLRVSHNPNDLPTPLPAPFDEMGEERVNEIIAKKEQMLHKVRELYEVNPMLGHRGVRLGITYPEIYAMQIRAILEAVAECMKEGIDIHPEMMVPQVVTPQELTRVKEIVDITQKEVEADYGIQLKFEFGTMIEVVRACMRAGHLAEIAEFFSFGTNDLTQAAFSFSREDAENKFLPLYNERGILQNNPFEVLDVKGVGQLMSMTVEWGRKSRHGLKVGICGEQGGHPASIRFCHHINLDYVSCSSPRVPIARLAAAHAKLLEDKYSI